MRKRIKNIQKGCERSRLWKKAWLVLEGKMHFADQKVIVRVNKIATWLW